MGRRRRGRGDHGHLQVPPPLGLGVEQGEIAGDALRPRGRRTARRNPTAVGLVRDLWAEVGPGIRAMGWRDRRPPCRPCPRERQATPQQVPGGAPLGRIARGLGPHPTAPEARQVVRSARVLWGLAPRARRPGEGLAQGDGHPLRGAEGGAPVPGEQAFDAADESLPVWGQGLEQGCGGGRQLPVKADLARLVKAAQRQGARVQVEATVKRVWRGVASPGVSSACGGR